MLIYDAFISYSHAKDKLIASALQSVIQKLGKAWYRRRSLRVFRDDTSLSATPQLWPSIQKALGESRYLILLASPEAAASPWIAKEVEYWLEHKSPNTLFIGLTDGELNWDGRKGDFVWSPHTPLPKALEGRFANEPKWVDLRAYRDGANPRNARFIELGADFAAAIHGTPKEDLLSEEVRQQRRARRLAVSAAASLLMLTLAAVGAAGIAAWQWQAAEVERALKADQLRQAQINESRYLGAQAREEAIIGNSDLSKSLLSLAMPKDWQNPERPIAPGSLTAVAEILTRDALKVILIGHTDSVLSAAFSHDAHFVLTASADKTARIWDAATGELLQVLQGHEGAVNTAVFNPDAKLVLTASGDGTARIWDAHSGLSLRVLKGHEHGVISAEFSPNGKRVLTASLDNTARIWDPSGGAPPLQLHVEHINTAHFSPDGNFVLTGSSGGTAIWDADTGAPLSLVKGREGDMFRAEFGPDGKLLLTVSVEGILRIWDATTRKLLQELKGHGETELTGAAFSADGERLLTVWDDGTARIWDVATGEQLQVLEGHEPLQAAMFSPDGKCVLTLRSYAHSDHGSWQHTARIWDARTGQSLQVLKGIHADNVVSAVFSGDSKHLLTASSDGTARIWDVAIKEPLPLLSHDDAIGAAIFSPDSRFVLTLAPFFAARIWDAATGKLLHVLEGHADNVTSGVFSPNGKLVLTASVDKTARIWNAATGEPLRVLQGHESYISTAVFSSDGKRVLTASNDKSARIWDAATGTLLRVLIGHEAGVASAAFSREGDIVLTGSNDGTARVWDAATGQQLQVLKGRPDTVLRPVFSADGERVLTTSDDDETARIWDAATGKLLHALRGHEKGVLGAVFSANSQRVLTWSHDRTARIWDVATGQPLRLLRGHENTVSTAMFSLDEKRVLTASWDGTARIWDAATGNVLQVLEIHDNGVNTAVFSPSGTLVLTTSDNIARIWSATAPPLQTAANFIRASISRPMTAAERTRFGLLDPRPSAPDEPYLANARAEVDLGRMYWEGNEGSGPHKDWEQALFHFTVAVRLFRAQGQDDSLEAKEAMLYRANLARRLPMDKVAEIWERAQAWKPGDAIPEFTKPEAQTPTLETQEPQVGASIH